MGTPNFILESTAQYIFQIKVPDLFLSKVAALFNFPANASTVGIDEAMDRERNATYLISNALKNTASLTFLRSDALISFSFFLL
jgi:hypothetical protein